MTPADAKGLLDELLARVSGEADRRAQCRALEREWAALDDYASAAALDLVTKWLAAQVKAIGAGVCVLGASGGVDSSLTAVVAQRAVPGRVRALIMPFRSSSADEADARRLLEVLGMPYRVVPLEPLVEPMLAALAPGAELSPTVAGNLASRVRCALLYFEANREGGLVLGTGNLDETYTGYATKGTTADLFPLGGLHKHEVRALLRQALTPLDAALSEHLAGRPASPGYWEGQRAEDELGLPYDALAAGLDLVRQHCSVAPEGYYPRENGPFLAAVEALGLGPGPLLRVFELLQRGYHKAVGSPGLWRPSRGRVAGG